MNKDNKKINFITLPIAFFVYEIILMFWSNSFSVWRFFLTFLFALVLGILIDILLSFTRIRKQIEIIIIIVFGIIYITEGLIHTFFNNFMTLNYAIEQAPNVFKVYNDIVLNLLVKNIVFIILYLMFMAIIIFYFDKIKIYASKVSLTILLTVFIFYICTTYVSINTYHGGFDIESLSNRFGFMGGYILGTFNIGKDEKLEIGSVALDNIGVGKSEEEKYNVINIDFDKLDELQNDQNLILLNEYIKNSVPSEKNKYTGYFKNKNLIMICAESFSKYVVDKNLTPTLYRLVHEGFYFDKYYTPKWGGSTGTGEYAFLTGQIPAAWNTSLYSTAKLNMSYNITSSLKKIGYNTMSFHNGQYKFYNRDQVYPNFGFDSYMAFGNGLEKLFKTAYDDIDMFDKTFDLYKDKEPFCVYYMTYSGHLPYDKDSELSNKYIDKVKEYYRDKYDDVVMRYLAKGMWLEDSLTLLLHKLEDSGLIDNTVICLTSDHYPYGLDGDNASNYPHASNLAGVDIDSTKLQVRDANHLIIWSKDLEDNVVEEEKKISDVTYSIDIEPTLLNLFGIDYDSRILPGRDVFAKNTKPIVVYNNGSFLSNEFNYFPSFEGKAFDNDGNEIDISADIIIEKQACAKNKLNFSSLFMKMDYYEKLVKSEKTQ